MTYNNISITNYDDEFSDLNSIDYLEDITDISIRDTRHKRASKHFTKLSYVKKRRIFSPEEDKIIKECVRKFGEDWNEIAIKLPGRTSKQVHDRYSNYLRAGLKIEPWTEEEDQILLFMFNSVGPKWSKMMRRLPGRSSSDIKNRWFGHTCKVDILPISRKESTQTCEHVNYSTQVFNINFDDNNYVQCIDQISERDIEEMVNALNATQLWENECEC